jgi:transposase-like protein
MVLEGGMTRAEVSRRLGVTATTISSWIKELTHEGRVVDQELRGEVKRLSEENRQLKMERDILKKATAFFANQK